MDVVSRVASSPRTRGPDAGPGAGPVSDPVSGPVVSPAQARAQSTAPAPAPTQAPDGVHRGPLHAAARALGLDLPSTGYVRTSVPVAAPWLGGVENAVELAPTSLQILEGALPPGLRGTLLRNGPGRFERGGERVPHWFDGDGGILRVEVKDGRATGSYRFVQSDAVREEETAGRFLRPVFGYLPAGVPCERSLLRAKNPSNTHVVAAGDRLLALYEGGVPVALHKDTLETIGPVDLGGLKPGETFTAHPHQDADDRTFAFAFDPRPGQGVSVLELDRAGSVIKRRELHTMDTPPHDFVSAGDFLVFVEPPVKMSPLGAIAGFSPVAESLRFNEVGYTRIHVVKKDTLEEVGYGLAPAFSSAHFGSARIEDDGSLSFVAFVPRENDPSGKAMARFTRGERVDVGGTPTRFHIDPGTGRVLKQVAIADVRAEWPSSDERHAGQCKPELWCATQSSRSGYFDGFARLDRTSGITDRFALPDGVFTNEPLFAPDANDEHAGWLTALVYDSRADRSEVWVMDAFDLQKGPVARVGLPSVVPFGFHGTFLPG